MTQIRVETATRDPKNEVTLTTLQSAAPFPVLIMRILLPATALQHLLHASEIKAFGTNHIPQIVPIVPGSSFTQSV